MKKGILYLILIMLIILGILLSYNFIKAKSELQNHKIEFGIDIEDKEDINLISYKKETRDKNNNLIEKEDANIYTLKMNDSSIVICKESNGNCKTYKYIKENIILIILVSYLIFII